MAESPEDLAGSPEPAEIRPSGDRQIDHILARIAENCAKEQYWNALSWAVNLAEVLMKRFDVILKR